MAKRKNRQLSATFVKRVSARDGKTRRYGDGRGGHGLSLLVKPTRNGRTSKTWSQRLRIDGREVNIGLGSYPVVELAEARKAALANRREVAQGRDPRGGGVPTFEAAAAEVIALHAKSWKPGGLSERQWRNSLRTYAFPRIGRKRVDRITTADVLSVLTAKDLWTKKPETGRRVLQRIGAVMKWAIAQGHRTDNPARDASAALPKNDTRKTHFPSVPHAEVAAALQLVRRSGAWLGTKLCIEFAVLTAARPGEARLATWAEIDFDSTTWTIAAARYKTGREHRVPLSPRAVEVLREASVIRHRRRSDLVFPSATGRAMANVTMTKLLRGLGIRASCGRWAVTHGFRSSFRVWCGDSGIDRELAERALGHTVRNPAEAAYNRGTLFARRREVMDRWGAYVAGGVDG